MSLEVKKSRKADLERRRPMFFAIALAAVTLCFVTILFFPYQKVGEMLDESFDDYSMDLDLKVDEQDDMISTLPSQTEQPEEAAQLNKVEETAEIAPEELESKPETTEDNEATEEEEEDEDVINLGDLDDETLRIVEQLPEYPGGMGELAKWLTANLKYPPQALSRRIQGKVMVSFVVNKDGSLSDIRLTHSVNTLLDTEALRVAKMMPAWKPGLENGRPCRTLVAIPIVFEI